MSKRAPGRPATFSPFHSPPIQRQCPSPCPPSRGPLSSRAPAPSQTFILCPAVPGGLGALHRLPSMSFSVPDNLSSLVGSSRLMNEPPAPASVSAFPSLVIAENWPTDKSARLTDACPASWLCLLGSQGGRHFLAVRAPGGSREGFPSTEALAFGLAMSSQIRLKSISKAPPLFSQWESKTNTGSGSKALLIKSRIFN